MVNIRSFLVALSCLILSIPFAHGGEFELKPAITVSEEYTDNVLNEPNNRIDDAISRVVPEIFTNYKSPAFTGELHYLFDYRYYAKSGRDNEIVNYLYAKGLLVPLQNLLFLELSEEYSRVSLKVTRDVTKESLYVDQTDRNLAIVSPYLLLRPGQRSTIKTGYRYVDTRYFDDGIDKVDHVGFLDLSHGLTEKFSLTAGYSFTHNDSDIDQYDQHQPYGGFRYEYGEKSFVFGQLGYTWTDHETRPDFNKMFWYAGVSHTVDSAVASVTTGVKYDEDPERDIIQNSYVIATLENSFKRGGGGLSVYFNEYVLTETDTLQTRKYGATVHGRHEFSARLAGRLAVTLEEYEEKTVDGDTRRLFVDSGVSYLLTDRLLLSLLYLYTEYNSKDIAADNKHVNRGIVELKYNF